MKRLLVAVALALSVSPAHAANLATPTATAAVATPAATASPDASQPRAQQNPALGGNVYERAEIFDGGLQIGKESDGASLLTFFKRGTCTFDIAALTAATASTGVPGVSKISCTATGTAVGDTVLTPGLHPYDTGSLVYEALTVSRCKALAADTITCWLHYGGFATPGLDPGALTLDYVVIR